MPTHTPAARSHHVAETARSAIDRSFRDTDPTSQTNKRGIYDICKEMTRGLTFKTDSSDDWWLNVVRSRSARKLFTVCSNDRIRAELLLNNTTTFNNGIDININIMSLSLPLTLVAPSPDDLPRHSPSQLMTNECSPTDVHIHHKHTLASEPFEGNIKTSLYTHVSNHFVQ